MVKECWEVNVLDVNMYLIIVFFLLLLRDRVI